MFWATLERVIWLVIGVIPGFALGLFAGGFPLTSWEESAKIALLGTAVIATLAAAIALAAMFAQRDTAKRRAAIDFFLRTEMDQAIIGAYEKFEELAPRSGALIKQPNFSKTHQDYKDLRRWLNICELIAVGINQDAFSERISLDYWGDVLPGTYRDAKEFIEFIRQKEGTSESFYELEKLIGKRKWRPRPAAR
jgi:hypothetical protein